MPTKKTPAQVAAENKAAVERAKIEAQKKAAAKPKMAMTKTYTSTKPKPTTSTSTTSNKTYKPNKPLPEVTVTAKRSTPAPKPVVSEDKYRYFGGERGKATPTKELTKAEYNKYYNSKDPNMGLTKILKSDTAKINNLQRSYGASTIKGFTPLKTKTTPKKTK